jgi:hypothetical protein
LENDQYQESIISGIEYALPMITIDNYDVNDGVIAALEIVVDANEASNDLTQATWQAEQLLSDFDVNVNNVYLTYSPTLVPSIDPTTSLPT